MLVSLVWLGDVGTLNAEVIILADVNCGDGSDMLLPDGEFERLRSLGDNQKYYCYCRSDGWCELHCWGSFNNCFVLLPCWVLWMSIKNKFSQMAILCVFVLCHDGASLLAIALTRAPPFSFQCKNWKRAPRSGFRCTLIVLLSSLVR